MPTMLKKIAMKMSVFACVIMMTPAFADDSDLYPEPVPADQQPQQEQADNHAQLSDQPSMNNEDNQQLSAQEQNIIGQDQAQFEEERNTLQPDHTNDPYFQNKSREEQVLQQDRERLENDLQAQDKSNAEVDRLKIKEDETLLKQYTAETHAEHKQIAREEDSVLSAPVQEQRNLQKYQQQKTDKPGGNPW
jgi:hypothetical protein